MEATVLILLHGMTFNLNLDGGKSRRKKESQNAKGGRFGRWRIAGGRARGGGSACLCRVHVLVGVRRMGALSGGSSVQTAAEPDKQELQGDLRGVQSENLVRGRHPCG